MGWEDSDRRSRLPADWPKIVQQVKKRDAGQCTWRLPSGLRCPRPGLDVDHIKNNDDHSLRNLRLLCEHHHGKKSAREGVWARRKKKAPRRPPERHPGTLG